MPPKDRDRDSLGLHTLSEQLTMDREPMLPDPCQLHAASDWVGMLPTAGG